ncbi:hypothetical protein PSHT_15075 [Puccinia striiformis]|uniref:Uncharacterized protein n=1 Tax=Puccinia striiformis TaxID=27350 RepID=A0A2S4UHE4_9BASI|nr:hypothetical protein PSHT_15075 [Puccinia striiformis]
MSSEAPKKPLSKLQRRIQAGLAGSASSPAAVQPKTSTGESGPMEIVETNLGVDSSTTSLTRDFRSYRPHLVSTHNLQTLPTRFLAQHLEQTRINSSLCPRRSSYNLVNRTHFWALVQTTKS